jgi:hypothetical protein
LNVLITHTTYKEGLKWADRNPHSGAGGGRTKKEVESALR